ncbi:CPBP family intramembrane glutamic endopeptidase [Actinoplanes sp. ATCC 53533]|uniref:CPBP family intramembrane glutamic endopeptidase n=1 Tax=Actinoplanes sp. ATCC 53533 TaxID=1288362 RepID=UPI0013153262|nr:type II CAAX endopeptidase family protein [Actinoplanes sp. ATCC 53533]
MGRTTRWWRPVVGTIAVLTGTGIVITAPTLIVEATRPQLLDAPLAALILSLAEICLALPLVLAITRWIGARPAGTLASVAGRLRWRWLGLCLLIAVPATLVIVIGSLVLTIATHSAAPSAASTPVISVTAGTLIALAVCLPVVVALTVVQSAAEEYVTRGWLLQAIGGFSRSPWPAITGQAGVFAVLHGLDGTVWGYADLTLYAIIVGWLAVSTGGLEAGIALHVAWNTTLAIPTCIVLALTDVDLDTQANVSGAPWQTLVVHLAGVTGYVLTVTLIARRRGRQASRAGTGPNRHRRVDVTVPDPTRAQR